MFFNSLIVCRAWKMWKTFAFNRLRNEIYNITLLYYLYLFQIALAFQTYIKMHNKLYNKELKEYCIKNFLKHNCSYFRVDVHFFLALVFLSVCRASLVHAANMDRIRLRYEWRPSRSSPHSPTVLSRPVQPSHILGLIALIASGSSWRCVNLKC